MTKIIRLGGLYDTEKRLKDRGAIFDPLDLSPTLNCATGGYGMPLITIKRYKNYISWRNKKGEFNTECNRASLEDDLALTIPTKDQTKVALSGGLSMLRIRKLTPKECMRLMGFTDEDYQALKEIGLSDSAIYHCAGDSIVTTCLVAMIYPFISEDRKGHQKVIQTYVEKEIVEGDKK